LDGDVSTTFYNQQQSSGALPFKENNAPVYVTANRSVVRISDDSVAFEGKARAWQKDNFISAETLDIQRAKKTLIATGGVRTLLFEMPRATSANSAVAVSGSAGSFTYSDSTRIAVYEKAVDLRQGQDRVQGGTVTVRIGNDRAVQSFNVKGDVVLTQIGRRATGEEALYEVVERKVSLKGNPARVVESGRGVAEGGTLTYFLDDKRVVGEGKSDENSKGRVRSVYQIDKQ
jgi:lipopolysaccharide transport protein LptA